MRHYQMYINGAWRDSDTCNPVLDKFTNTPYAQYAVTTPEEVNEAVAAAFVPRACSVWNRAL